MKLNHLDLQVPDVPETAAFFERHFGLRILGNRTSPALIILDDGHGFSLVLQRRREPQTGYPEGFHIGFLVEDVGEVIARREQITSAGVACGEIIENGRGTMFYLTAPGGITVEVNCRRASGRG